MGEDRRTPAQAATLLLFRQVCDIMLSDFLHRIIKHLFWMSIVLICDSNVLFICYKYIENNSTQQKKADANRGPAACAMCTIADSNLLPSKQVYAILFPFPIGHEASGNSSMGLPGSPWCI